MHLQNSFKCEFTPLNQLIPERVVVRMMRICLIKYCCAHCICCSLQRNKKEPLLFMAIGATYVYVLCIINIYLYTNTYIMK